MGRYTLLRRIAQGGMAEVWLARVGGASGFAKRVALKRILPHHAHEERFVAMLVDEAKIAVELAHPNIAQILELGVDGEDFFIAMEYVPGPPLARIMRAVGEKGRLLPIPHAVHIVGEVAKGLAHAHAHRGSDGQLRGIVHRDVSPQNILLTYDGAVKLIDFGIARAADRVARTNHGVIKGKLRYLAPEIAQGLEPDGRADIFCAGVVLFELLTGQALYAPRDDFEAIEMATRGQARSPREVNPDVPAELDAIVLKALHRDRGERYANAMELQDALRRYSNLAHPSFVESELQSVMRFLFGEEAEKERELDREAESAGEQAGMRASETRTLVAAPSASRAPPVPTSPVPAPAPSPVAVANEARPKWGLGLALIAAFLVGSAGFLFSRLGQTPSEPPLPAEASETFEALPPAAALEAPEPEQALEPSFETEPEDPSVETEPEAPLDPAPKPRKPRTRGYGRIDVNARPASVVFVDGRRVGRTPLEHRVGAGRHVVTLVGPDGRKKRFTRTVRAGRTDELRYRW